MAWSLAPTRVPVAKASVSVEIRPHHQAHSPHVAAPLGSLIVVRWHAQSLRVARSLTSLTPNRQWLRRECSAFVEPDSPRVLMTEVVVVRSDEDDSHALPKRMTNEDVTRMQCRTVADIVSTYSPHAIQYSAMRQYTSTQKINGHVRVTLVPYGLTKRPCYVIAACSEKERPDSFTHSKKGHLNHLQISPCSV